MNFDNVNDTTYVTVCPLLPGALFAADYHVDLDLVAPPPRRRVARAGVPRAYQKVNAKGTILG